MRTVQPRRSSRLATTCQSSQMALNKDVQVVHQRTIGLSRLRVIEHGEEHRWSKYIGHPGAAPSRH